MKYFHIMTGLRGGYTPDDAYVVACRTRTELKSALMGELATLPDERVGATKKETASVAALAWQEYPKASLPMVIAWGDKRQLSGRPYGIFVSPARRADYQEQLGL